MKLPSLFNLGRVCHLIKELAALISQTYLVILTKHSLFNLSRVCHLVKELAALISQTYLVILTIQPYVYLT